MLHAELLGVSTGLDCAEEGFLAAYVYAGISLCTAVAGRAKQCTCVRCILDLTICFFRVRKFLIDAYEFGEDELLTLNDPSVISFYVVHAAEVSDIAPDCIHNLV